MAPSVAQDAIFQPVHPPTTFEETVERLGTAIKLGLLPPGPRLPTERDLAEQLGISRSTLRHALMTLVQSGHLVSLRGRRGGTFVAESPPLAHGVGRMPPGPVLRALLEYRLAIEAGAALLAAERSTGIDLEGMTKLVDRMADVERYEDYRRADIRFHIAIAEAAHSPRLVAAVTEVQGRMTELMALVPHAEHVRAQSNAQHRRLVDTLARRDAAGAVLLIREHLKGTEHILIGLS